MRSFVALACVCFAAPVVLLAQSADDLARWKAESSRITVVRDDWGIAHIHGYSDADAVFGMVYAQCEDDFNRVERNYIIALGRTAEAEGESAIWQDLRQRLFIDPEVLKQDYAQSPEWLRKLMDEWADGINYYLATHPDTHPKVLTHFEPWMALSFTEGSVGGDIERVNLIDLKAFYSADKTSAATSRLQLPQFDWFAADSSGSNGIAIAPSNTVDHHALLLINPHTSFFFRSELQMTSDEGLDAYGAVTWGQFFIYQGFNPHVGWMHTSSNVDAVDRYLESIVHQNGKLAYRFGEKTLPITEKQIRLRYKSPQGLVSRNFTALYTVHGPVIARNADKFVSVQLMNQPISALEQSYLRTKATNYAEYKKTMELRANSSNNTVFADADGDIAYWQADFIPRRDTRFDYTKLVDGSNPATNWNGLLSLDEVPHLLNPKSGFLFNVNDSPWNGAGASSLRKADYPAYVERGIESARGHHAMRLLNPDDQPRRDFTVESLLRSAFDSYLPWFARTIPALTAAYDALPADSPQKKELAPQVALLRNWDDRWGADSAATSLAIFWGTELVKISGSPAWQAKIPTEDWVATRVPAATLLSALSAASARLASQFGSWQTPWGHINRFQRVNDKIEPQFSDSDPSIPVPFTYSGWGSLASFSAHPYPGTTRWYGSDGNSFVAVVEFGPRIRAVGITAGGESGNPKSPHFDDEALRYASGNLREIYFYPDQLQAHTERTYHPGE